MKQVNSYFNKAQDSYRNYASVVPVRQSKPPTQQLDQFERTYTVKASLIDTALAGKATIFGAAWDLTETTNTANNVKVEIVESSHSQVKTNLLQNPFKIGDWKIIASDELQLAEPLSITSKTSFGATKQKTVQPMNYIAASDMRKNMVDIRDAKLRIDAETGIEVNLLAGAYFTMVVKVSEILDVAAAMSNSPVVKSVR